MEIDPTKLLFIAVAALILLGPERLPDMARRAGELWSQLKGHRDRLTQQIGSIPGLPGTAVSSFLSDAFDPTRQLRGVIDRVQTPLGTVGATRDEARPAAPATDDRSSTRESWLPSGFAPGSPDLN